MQVSEIGQRSKYQCSIDQQSSILDVLSFVDSRLEFFSRIAIHFWWMVVDRSAHFLHHYHEGMCSALFLIRESGAASLQR